jgi:hypothetical protein
MEKDSPKKDKNQKNFDQEEAQNLAKEMMAAAIIEQMEGDKIMWLTGKAPEQHNDQPVNISGTITAPSLFLDKREGEFYDKRAHALVSKTDGEIKLVINEETVCKKYTITGQVEVGKKFAELGINTYENPYTPLELVKKLRLRRSIFKSVVDHTNLLATLSNVEANVSKQMDEMKDDRANYNFNFKQTVTSNIPETFNLLLPIIEGEEPVEIEVAVLLEVESGKIVCYLESVDGADLIEEAFTKLVENEVEKIKDKVTVIYR